MKKTLLIAFSLVLMTGCATAPTGESNALTNHPDAAPTPAGESYGSKFLSGVKFVTKKAGEVAVSGMNAVNDMATYENGVEITQSQLDTLVKGKSKGDEVVAMVGHPMRTESKKGFDLWYYDYSMISQFKADVSESTVIKVSSKGTVLDFYKTGRSGKSGNALLDAANGF
jgi:outer membrane protein assembly factor BamE (lipoprotein component of BamABCDE complex)